MKKEREHLAGETPRNHDLSDNHGSDVETDWLKLRVREVLSHLDFRDSKMILTINFGIC